MRLAYVAAPYGASCPESIARNVDRAVTLCKRAVTNGYAPVCVHPTILAGGYGDDDDPADRERGLLIVIAIVEAIAQADGALFVLVNDRGFFSAGTQREVDAYIAAGGAEVHLYRWDEDFDLVLEGVCPPRKAACHALLETYRRAHAGDRL